MSYAFDELTRRHDNVEADCKRKLLRDVLVRISEKNPFQEKYLEKSMSGITIEEAGRLKHLISFYAYLGDTPEQVADKYLAKIDFIQDAQKYFIEYGKYRYSNFEEVEALYQTPDYMNSYVVGLGLSIYLWDTHRNMMRFFLDQLGKNNTGRGYLEIGPGHGEYFVTAMRNSSYDRYLAVDISQTSVDITRKFCQFSLKNENRNYEIQQKNFFDFDEKEKFDAIVMGEVLEHVDAPVEFLKKIYELSTPNSFIFISTAVNAPQPDHIFHFRTIAEVRDLMNDSGFIITDEAAYTANGYSIEKALKKKRAIVVGFILKKMSSGLIEGSEE